MPRTERSHPGPNDDGAYVSKELNLRSHFGNRVGEKLREVGLSPADLANLSKLPTKRLERIIEGSYKRLTMRDMDIIAQTLGTPLHELLAPPDP